MAWITPPVWQNGMIVEKAHMDVLNNDLVDLDTRVISNTSTNSTQTTNITTLNNAVGIPWSGGTALSRIQGIETNLGTWSGGTAISRIVSLESAVGTAPSRYIRRTNTAATAIGTGFVAIPFATTTEGSLSGLSTSDDINFVFVEPGIWTVTANIVITQNTGVIASLHMGTNADPFNAANTRIYALQSGSNSGSIGSVVLSAEIHVATASLRSVRCSAFATAGTLRTGIAAPSLTFSWRPI